MVNLRRYLSLQIAITEAIDSIPSDTRATSGRALPMAYLRFRKEARDLIPQEDQEEFDRVCPEWGHPGTLLGRQSALRVAENYAEAKVLLSSLRGFLQGYVDQARLEMEAEARSKAERKRVGFGPE